MNYQRKTKDVYVMLANYGQGWEEEIEEESWRALREQLKCYRENAPQYAYLWRKRREKLN